MDSSGLKKFWAEHWRAVFILFSVWGTYFLALWSRIILLKPDGLYLGHVNVWSDWALHIGLASIFAYKDPQFWFAYHPMYAEGQLTYPFLADFISGMLMRAGFSMPASFVIPSIFFTILLLTGLYILFCLTLRSKYKAFLAISIFFLSSGLGFTQFVGDFLNNPDLGSILYPAKEYSRLDSYQWYSGNVVTGFLLPQRNFLFGMTLAVWVLVMILSVFLKKEVGSRTDKALLLAAGFMAGLLPITHPHSFIVLIIISAFLTPFFIRKLGLWLYYTIPAAAISSFFYLKFIYGGIENSHYFSWMPGWTMGGFGEWIKIWLYLWGVMIPLAIFGWFTLRKNSTALVQAFFLGFFALFILGNLFLFQPIPWDNSKIFIWAYLGFSSLAACAIFWFWQRRTIGKILAAILIFGLVATGMLELVRLQGVDRNKVLETSADDIALGLQIREKTHPLAVFLTAPSHNHFVMMWGARPVLLGYTAWVWNFGFLYQQTERDIAVMYQGGLAAEDLLKRYKISYVVIGPRERHDFQPNEYYFESNFPVAFKNQNYKIYDVRRVSGR